MPPPPDYRPRPIAIPDEIRSGHIGCFGTTRVGKAQPLDARIWTPTGWRRLGEVRVGWTVGTPAGRWATVTAVYPQGRRPIDRLWTEDDRSTRATADHLWRGRVGQPGEWTEGCFQTKHLREFLQHGFRVELPLTRPIRWQQPQHLDSLQGLDPFLLGALIVGALRSEGQGVQLAPGYGRSPALRRQAHRLLRLAIQRWRKVTGKPEAALAQRLAVWQAHPVRLAQWLDGLPDPAGWPLETRQALIAWCDQLASADRTVGWWLPWLVLDIGRWLQRLIWSCGGKAALRPTSDGAMRLLVTCPTGDAATPQADDAALDYGVAITAIVREDEAEAVCLQLDDPAGLYLTDDWLVTHNTRLMETIIRQDIQKGYSVVAIDPKGDHELMSAIVQAAVETGRLEEVMLLTPIFPRYSIQVGPLTSYYMQEELVNMLISGVKAREEFFVAIAQEVAMMVVAGELRRREIEGDRRPLTFQDIKDRIGFKDLQEFIKDLEPVPGVERIVHSLKQMVDSPNLADYWSKISSTFRTFLSAVTMGATGEIIGRAVVNPVITRLEREQPIILVVQMGSLLTQRTSGLVGKLLVAMIQALVGRLFASGRKLVPPLCLHIDEGHNILYPGFQELINKGGGANCWVHFYTQSLAQIEAEVGPEYARSIVDNINTWIYFLVNHPETAAHVEAASPQRTRYETIVPAGEDPTTRITRRPAITADRVMQLPKRWFYCRSYGTVWKGQTLESPPAWLRIQWPSVRVHGAESDTPTAAVDGGPNGSHGEARDQPDSETREP
jgi:hypothetical protein